MARGICWHEAGENSRTLPSAPFHPRHRSSFPPDLISSVPPTQRGRGKSASRKSCQAGIKTPTPKIQRIFCFQTRERKAHLLSWMEREKPGGDARSRVLQARPKARPALRLSPPGPGTGSSGSFSSTIQPKLPQKVDFIYLTPPLIPHLSTLGSSDSGPGCECLLIKLGFVGHSGL